MGIDLRDVELFKKFFLRCSRRSKMGCRVNEEGKIFEE